MILAAIVAMDENNAIGIDGGLPWHLPEDLKFFKRTTMGCPVLMGRKTFASLKKPLPGRLNIVISRQKDLELPEGVLLFDSLEDGLKRLAKEDANEGFVIGGGNIYEQSMKLVDRLYITVVHTKLDKADTHFPHVDHAHWKLSWKEEHEADERHQFAFTFQKWDRIIEI
ncbi:MAG: dihydrofolate reductase [Chitinophagales bacterium]|nr:dihydrofolate reductase [Chitinophagaceae bacterium]MCB9063909.1 dihydrofolate reductase [Chitinophagales bacterium]